MKKRILTFVIFVVLLTFNNKVFGQLSISYQYSSLNKIGLGYNFTERIWTELHLYSNTNLDNFTPELVGLYNISKKDNHDVYFGIGLVANFFTGIVVPVGLQFRPLENFKRLSLIIEFEPTIDIDREDLIFQSSAGLRYSFGKD